MRATGAARQGTRAPIDPSDLEVLAAQRRSGLVSTRDGVEFRPTDADFRSQSSAD